MLHQKNLKGKKRWKKHINIVDAREFSRIFCEHFNIPDCEIYYVDVLTFEPNVYGVYLANPPTALMLEKGIKNPIGILAHELTHHLENEYYWNKINANSSSHGYSYQLAKQRVLTYLNKYISPISKSNWYLPLKALQTDKDMYRFRI